MKKTFTALLFSVALTAFSQVSPQTYTTPGIYTFTVPASVTTISIEVVGAGGSGGGNGGGGGGGGGYAKGSYNVVPGATLAVKVGAGGSGSSAGTSSVSGLISATGGANGVSVSNPNIGGGGAAGVGSGGAINNSGGIGGGGYWTYFGGGGAGAGGPLSNGSNGGNTIAWTGVCQTPGGLGGNGGGAPGGNGGKGAGFTDSGCNVTDPAANGGNFGAGGGGGNGNGGPASNGANGFCEITWSGCSVPAAPTNTTPVTNQMICANNTTTLSAAGTATVNWYSTPTSTTSLFIGNSYTTPTLTAGNYTYYAASTNTCGEGPRSPITVTVNAIPSVSATSNASLICNGQSATLTASGATTYSWSTSAPTNSIIVSPTVTTSYTVTGTINNCANTSVITQNVSACTGLALMNGTNTSAINIYPNPNKGDFTISTDKEINLSIVNNLGQLVKTISSTATNNYKASVTDLPNGIYFITSSNDKNIKQKIVVSK